MSHLTRLQTTVYVNKKQGSPSLLVVTVCTVPIIIPRSVIELEVCLEGKYGRDGTGVPEKAWLLPNQPPPVLGDERCSTVQS